MRRLILIHLFFALSLHVAARSYTDQEAYAAWDQLKKQPVDNRSFQQTCDLIQDIAQNNINISYEIFAQYTPMVQATKNKTWMHVLLMSWARAKESLSSYEQADSLYRAARMNAAQYPALYDEAMVGSVLLYLEWDKQDSLAKYLAVGEKICRANKDPENLSFIYTFKAMSQMSDTASMRINLDSAIFWSKNLPNKNAAFTAMYNRAVFYYQFNLQKQVDALDQLLDLSKDSSLSVKPRLYQRTAFSFRSPIPSIYYQLMLVNLLLTDYDNAWKFAELFYEAMVKPNPTGALAPNFTAVMAMVKAYQGNFADAEQYLSKSRELFQVPENKITYPTYHIAAGIISEHQQQSSKALMHFETAYRNGSMSYGLHLMPPAIYYSHGLIAVGRLDSAEKVLADQKPILATRTYSAIGYYYYKYDGELLKAKGDFKGYNHAMETFYAIKDSLTNILHYRAIQEVETRMRVHDKEQQINRLNDENMAKQKALRQQWAALVVFILLSSLIIALLIAYARNQTLRKKQAEEIAKQKEILQQSKIMEMQKQHRIEIMQGAIDAEENERHKIADQLHDEAGGMLALASLNISSTLEKGNLDAASMEKTEKAYEILTNVSSTIRNISHQLTPLVIEKYGFKKAIEDMAHSINLSGKLKIETVMVGFEDDSKYPIVLLNNLYRIVQELVHNILKHADAQHARVELVEHEKQISIMVEDDGVGMKDYRLSKGKGLESIQSKIAYLNGRMEIENKQDKGTLVVIEINL